MPAERLPPTDAETLLKLSAELKDATATAREALAESKEWRAEVHHWRQDGQLIQAVAGVGFSAGLIVAILFVTIINWFKSKAKESLPPTS